MARGGLYGVRLPHHLIGAWEGEDWNLENVTMRLVPIFSAQSLPHTMLGAGLDEDGECVEEDRDLLGIQDFSKQDLWGEEGADKADKILIKSENPHVRMWSCQSACSSLHKRGA